MTELKVPAVCVTQPIGQFYVGKMRAEDLVSVSKADMRRIEGPVDRFVGIQRQLSRSRVDEIGRFVRSVDATFPTSVVLAVPGACATFDEELGVLVLHEGVDEATGEQIPLDSVASILDGQHRVEGLKHKSPDTLFEVPVSIFVEADVADQAYIFATVNLAQTKVNRSLVYDLLDYATARSPQKSAHDVAVAMDLFPESPFYSMIKRLGTATPGRSGETLAQATVVGSILPLISTDPEGDRYALAKKQKVTFDSDAYPKTPLRGFWVDAKDTEMAAVLVQYFNAVAKRWPIAWASREKGAMLSRTNGFRAMVRLFKLIYLKERPVWQGADAGILGEEAYARHLRLSALSDADFNSNQFKPGSTGESELFKRLRDELKL